MTDRPTEDEGITWAEYEVLRKAALDKLNKSVRKEAYRLAFWMAVEEMLKADYAARQRKKDAKRAAYLLRTGKIA